MFVNIKGIFIFFYAKTHLLVFKQHTHTLSLSYTTISFAPSFTLMIDVLPLKIQANKNHNKTYGGQLNVFLI